MIPKHTKSPPVAVMAQAGFHTWSMSLQPHHAVGLSFLFAGVYDEAAAVGFSVPEDQHQVGVVHDLHVPPQGGTSAVPFIIGLELGEEQVMGMGVGRRALVDAAGSAADDFGGFGGR